MNENVIKYTKNCKSRYIAMKNKICTHYQVAILPVNNKYIIHKIIKTINNSNNDFDKINEY